MRIHRLTALVATSLTLGLLAPSALAQSDADRATARSLGLAGEQALDVKDFKTAEDNFRRADQLVHAPTLELGLARALAGGGKYVESQETYNRIIREGLPPGASEAFKHALDNAKKEVETVTPKVGAVTITVKGAGGTDLPSPDVSLDGKPVNSASLGVRRAIDPGSHTLHVTAAGYKAADVTFATSPGGAVDEPVTLEQDLTAAPTAVAPVAATNAAQPTGTPAGEEGPSAGPSKARAIAPFIAFGVGGAGLAVGAITGLMAASKHSSLSTNCPGGSCPASESSDLSSYHSLGTVSTVGFILAGVGAAVGVVLLVTLPKKAPSASASGVHVVPMIGAGTLGAMGTF